MSTMVLINNATAAVIGTPQNVQTLRTPTDNRTFQASGKTTSGSGTASVNVEVSNDNVNWILMGTIGLTLSTTPSTDGFVSIANWTYVRGNVTSITAGVGATVSLFMGL
jgi:hypothetical protein